MKWIAAIFDSAPLSLLACGLAAAALLGTALGFQYLGGLPPCTLCHWQRVPYVAIAMLALAGLAVPALRAHARALVALAALLFLCDAGIAFFHVGVEHGWWAGTSSCATTAVPPGDFDALKAQILGTVKVANCADPAWIFLGLSMAFWNGLCALCLAALAGLAAWRGR